MRAVVLAGEPEDVGEREVRGRLLAGNGRRQQREAEEAAAEPMAPPLRGIGPDAVRDVCGAIHAQT